jgi:sulfane dehydrogenase subunit SoxC
VADATRIVPGATVASGGRGILKPVSPELLVDHRDGTVDPDDPTGDLALNAEMRWEAMKGRGYLTPVDRFFVRNHAPTPRIDPATWELRVEGPGVGRPVRFTYDDLWRLPSSTAARALECAGNGRVFFAEDQDRETPGTPWRLGAVGVAEWTGVALREVLERAGLRESAREVMLEGLDEVRVRRPLPVEKALEDTLLAYGMNGVLLPHDHGFPLRAVVPGWAAVASVKWLGRVFVSDAFSGPLASPWNTAKYVLTGGAYERRRVPVLAQVPKSALELAWPATLRRGPQTITGRSWSAGAPVARVEYAVDAESRWRPAELFGPNLPGAWARWRFVWDAPRGKYEVRVRATDAAGNAQPEQAKWNELGYLYGGVVAHPVEVI